MLEYFTLLTASKREITTTWAFTGVHHMYSGVANITLSGRPSIASRSLPIRYFVDTVSVNEEIVRRYVRHQDKKDQELEMQMQLLQD